MAAKTQRIGLFPEEIRFRGAVRAVALGAETGAYRAVDPEAVPSRRFRGFRFVAADTQLAQRGDQFPGDDPGFCHGPCSAFLAASISFSGPFPPSSRGGTPVKKKVRTLCFAYRSHPELHAMNGIAASTRKKDLLLPFISFFPVLLSWRGAPRGSVSVPPREGAHRPTPRNRRRSPSCPPAGCRHRPGTSP